MRLRLAACAEAARFTFQRVLDPEQKSPNRANLAEIARAVPTHWAMCS